MATNEIQTRREWRWWERPDGSPSDKLVKLELAFAEGNSDELACAFAEITLDQLYYYTRKINPDFQVRKEHLKVKPILAANGLIMRAITDYTDEQGVYHPGDVKTAKWYLERKRKKEFSLRTEVTGNEGESLYVPLTLEQKIKLRMVERGIPFTPTVIAEEVRKAQEGKR